MIQQPLTLVTTNQRFYFGRILSTIRRCVPWKRRPLVVISTRTALYRRKERIVRSWQLWVMRAQLPAMMVQHRYHRVMRALSVRAIRRVHWKCIQPPLRVRINYRQPGRRTNRGGTIELLWCWRSGTIKSLWVLRSGTSCVNALLGENSVAR